MKRDLIYTAVLRDSGKLDTFQNALIMFNINIDVSSKRKVVCLQTNEAKG